MKIQDYRQYLADQHYLTQTILSLYQQEEEKLEFAKMQLLHLFFENGIRQNYPVHYLENMCGLLEQVSTHIFSFTVYPSRSQNTEDIDWLVHFALLPDLEMLDLNLRFYELIFSALEAYEVCANISYLQRKVKTEIIRKATQEPQTPKVRRLN